VRFSLFFPFPTVFARSSPASSVIFKGNPIEGSKGGRGRARRPPQRVRVSAFGLFFSPRVVIPVPLWSPLPFQHVLLVCHRALLATGGAVQPLT
jgi:hypothetical protein